MAAEAESIRETGCLCAHGLLHRRACLSLHGVVAHPFLKVMTGMVEKALVSRPQSGFDLHLTRGNSA